MENASAALPRAMSEAVDSTVFVFFINGPHGWWLVLYMATCVVSGVIIGAVGPGGVMLAPALLLLDVPMLDVLLYLSLAASLLLLSSQPSIVDAPFQHVNLGPELCRVMLHVEA